MATAPPAAETPPANGNDTQAVVTPSEMYRNYNFLLRIETTEIRFTECIGLGMRIEPIRYRESGQHSIVRALPGPLSHSELILRYGVTDTLELWDWLKTTAEGNVRRKNVTVVQLGNDGNAQKINWNLFDAWPCQWLGVPFDSLGREAAIEEVRLAYDRIERA